MRDDSYFSVKMWMVTELKLKGAERDVYAIIYGFSQDGESDFHGSLSYISKITGYSKNAICTALQSLTNKGYIKKTEKIINNIKFCRYHTTCLDTIQATCTETISENEKTIQATCTNNKIYSNRLFDNKKENKNIDDEIQEFKNLYSEHCTNLPKVYKLTEKRIKAIKNIIKKYSRDEIIQVFDLANESDFLTGGGDRNWKADIDFILREDKFINILEGKYGGRRKKSNISSDMGRTAKRMTTEQKQKFKEDIASGKAERI